MPAPGRYMFVAGVADNRVYCVGGNDGSGESNRKLHVYDVGANRWQDGAPWPTPSAYPCGAVVGRKLYVVGGPNRDDSPISVLHCYDPAIDKWERLADLPLARSHSVAVAKGEKLYVIGGYGRSLAADGSRVSQDIDDVSIFDPKNGRWSKGPRLPEALHGMAAAVNNGTIHLIGGLTAQRQHLILDGDKWVKKAEAPFSVVKMPATCVQGKIIVIGGGEQLTRTAIYDCATDKWMLGPDTRVPRFLAQLVTVGDTAYALGGIVEGGGAQTKVEAFDVKRNMWRE